MDKIYRVLVYNKFGTIIGAFTTLEAFDQVHILHQEYDLSYGYWTKEHIMVDNNLSDFDLIKHD